MKIVPVLIIIYTKFVKQKHMKKNKLFIALCFIAGVNRAQTCFNVGDGSGGAFNATTNTSLAGGSYSFTTFNIDPGVQVNVTGTTPLQIYCTGSVTINGTLSVKGGNGNDALTFSNAGLGGIGVAGGANGGDGSFSSSSGPIIAFAGSGTGGAGNQGDAWSGGGGAGYANTGGSSGNSGGGFGGSSYGTANLTVLDAGSGGGGGSGGYDCGGGGGGAGGGVIVINSGVSVMIGAAGAINSDGGNGGSDDNGNCGGGGGGSGGTIWLAANAITNNGLITAQGGTIGASAVAGTPYFGEGGAGSEGRIRFDVNSFTDNGVIQPQAAFTGTLGLPFEAIISGTNTCANAAMGAAAITPSNGVSPYTVSWIPINMISPTISNLPAGTYTAVSSDGAGCTVISTIEIIANPNPTVSILSVPAATVCSGQTITLIAGGASTVTWSGAQDNNPILNITPTITTTYSVNGVDQNNCTGSAIQTITVNALPSVTLTASSAAVCSMTNSGKTVTLTGLPANGNYSGTNVSGNIFTPSSVGTFTSTYSYTNAVTGCSNTAQVSILVSLCTGLADNSSDNFSLNIYPNPSSGNFIIGVNEKVELEIRNALGQLVSEKTLEEGQHAVDLSSEANGIYFISISTQNKTHTEKIIKN